MSLCGLPGCGNTRLESGACKLHQGMETWIEPPNYGTGMKPTVTTVTDLLMGDNERGGGLKFDGDKPRWTLMMQGLAYALAQVVQVLTFGARKYQAHSWRKVENAPERYRDALYRHLAAYEAGEVNDPESGLPHLSHVTTNAMFLLELDKERTV